MQPPVDYPIVDSARDTEFSEDELTHAAFLDRMTAIDKQREHPLIEAPVFSLRSKEIAPNRLFRKDLTGALSRLGLVTR